MTDETPTASSAVLKLGHLAIQSVGDGLPILFIHGWTISGAAEAWDFEPVFIGTSGFRRIYIDLPGMGLTPAGNIRNLDDIYDHVAAFVRLNLAGRPFLVAGTSCGAYLARAVAHEFQDQVKGLLLRVPLVEPDSSKRDIGQIMRAVRNPEVANLVANEPDLASIPVQTSLYVDKFRDKLKNIIMPAIDASDNDVLSIIRDDSTRYVLTKQMHDTTAPFRRPTLLITGRQDGVVGYKDAWKLLDIYPRASFVLLDRADHGFPIDEQDLFKQLVLDWLKRVEEIP